MDTHSAPNWCTVDCYASKTFRHIHFHSTITPPRRYDLTGRVVLVINTDRSSPEVYITHTDKLGVVVSDDFVGGFRCLGFLLGTVIAKSFMQSSSISTSPYQHREHAMLCSPLTGLSRGVALPFFSPLADSYVSLLSSYTSVYIDWENRGDGISSLKPANRRFDLLPASPSHILPNNLWNFIFRNPSQIRRS